MDTINKPGLLESLEKAVASLKLSMELDSIGADKGSVRAFEEYKDHMAEWMVDGLSQQVQARIIADTFRPKSIVRIDYQFNLS